jgi:hypothetical protein
MTPDQDSDTLHYLWDPRLDPLFWRPERLGAASAWWGHVPFAHWVVSEAQPRLLVELGTGTGVSYSAFCETVSRERLKARCIAVDTWKGDQHTGLYGEDVYSDFRQFHDDRYGAFSTLLRCPFDAALEHVADGSIDLLHIDGVHTYEIVRHDFENWQSKLSDRAVVLFHDTNVREEGFGVWRIWSELRDRFPSFEFLHCHGLGVLAVGDHTPPAVAALCVLDNRNAMVAVRERFRELGEHWVLHFRRQTFLREMASRDAQITELRATVARIQDQAGKQDGAEARLRLEAERARDEAIRQANIESRLRLEAERARDEAIGQANTESRLRPEAERARDEAIRQADVEVRLRLEAVRARAEALRQAEREKGLRLEAVRARAEALRQAEGEKGLRLEAVRARDEMRDEAAKVLAHSQTIKAECQAFATETECLRSALARATAEWQAVLTSTTWQATWPLRAALDTVRGAKKLIQRAVTPDVPGTMHEQHRQLDHVADGAAAGGEVSTAIAAKDEAAGFRLQEVAPAREIDEEIANTVGLPQTEPGPMPEDLLRQRFGMLEPLRSYLMRGGPKRVTLVTDSINAGSLYGGVMTAIILSALLAERMGADLRLVTRTEVAAAENFGLVLAANGVQWSGNVEFLYSPAGRGREVPVTKDDLFVTTSWWTTWSTKRAVDSSRIVYFLGDDERMFYPHGDERLRCAETLAEADIRFVVNSELLFEHLTTGPEAFANIKANGMWFEPALPASLYYQDPSPRVNGKRNFLFYARPHNLRNLYWRGLEAIGAAIEEGILQPREWNLHFNGRDLSGVVLPRGVRPRISQNLPLPEYAALVRQTDVGVSLIDTPHPSYPPLDLAASGAVVVTNRHGLKTSLARYSENILCVEPTVDGLKNGIAKATLLAADEPTRTANYAHNGMLRDWAVAFEPVLRRLIPAAEY